MQVVSVGQLLWIYTLLFTSLQLWGRLSASTSSPILPAPVLDISSRSNGSVVLVCRAPESHLGVHFMLYRERQKVNSVELEAGAQQVQFTLSLQEADPAQKNLFCCLYRIQDGHYSLFSPYLQVDLQKDATPTRPIPSFPPPVLSVQPSSGEVRRGETLSFSCSFQPQSQSSSNKKQVNFFLLRTAEGTGVTSVIPQPQAGIQGSNSEPQPGVFTVGPVSRGDQGEYTCFYQINRRRTPVNSSVSNMVQITVTDLLPPPTLALQQQSDVWYLLCTGSPAYPNAEFSLYQADNKLPVDTYRATLMQHQVTFQVPVQEAAQVYYRCQYRVHLGRKWSSSERSLPLAVTKGSPSPPSPDVPAVDWPLVLGSLSVAVLFFCSVILVAVLAHRKVKAAAKEKKKREEAQFWTKVHAKDHVVDLTLRRTSFTSQEYSNVGSTTETDSRSPLWNSLSTFTTPIHPIH